MRFARRSLFAWLVAPFFSVPTSAHAPSKVGRSAAASAMDVATRIPHRVTVAQAIVHRASSHRPSTFNSHLPYAPRTLTTPSLDLVAFGLRLVWSGLVADVEEWVRLPRAACRQSPTLPVHAPGSQAACANELADAPYRLEQEAFIVILQPNPCLVHSLRPFTLSSTSTSISATTTTTTTPTSTFSSSRQCPSGSYSIRCRRGDHYDCRTLCSLLLPSFDRLWPTGQQCGGGLLCRSGTVDAYLSTFQQWYEQSPGTNDQWDPLPPSRKRSRRNDRCTVRDARLTRSAYLPVCSGQLYVDQWSISVEYCTLATSGRAWWDMEPTRSGATWSCTRTALRCITSDGRCWW